MFHKQEKYAKKVLSADYKVTLTSKYLLVVTLHEQEKYIEVEQLLRHLVQQREKVLGAEYVDTLSSKYWLAATLYK
jgi:hypothetical protein